MADDFVPDPAKILKMALQTMSAQQRRQKYNKISYLDDLYWFSSQRKFMDATGGTEKGGPAVWRQPFRQERRGRGFSKFFGNRRPPGMVSGQKVE